MLEVVHLLSSFISTHRTRSRTPRIFSPRLTLTHRHCIICPLGVWTNRNSLFLQIPQGRASALTTPESSGRTKNSDGQLIIARDSILVVMDRSQSNGNRSASPMSMRISILVMMDWFLFQLGHGLSAILLSWTSIRFKASKVLTLIRMSNG